MLRILLATLLALALVACDDGTRNPVPNPPAGDENPIDDPAEDEDPAGEPGGDEDYPEGEAPARKTIDLSRAVALGLGQAPATPAALAAQSGAHVVLAVNEDGEIETVEDDEATFRDFRVIDGRVFLTPNSSWDYGCALVEVVDDTSLECVDPFPYEINELQIGPDGTLYYRGWAHMEGSGPGPVLRRRTPDGQHEMVFDLEGPLNVESWAVASDGLLFLAGSSRFGGASEHWLRRQNEDGSITTVATAGAYNYYTLLGVWPDGNLYLMGSGSGTLWQIRPDEGTIHPIPYLGGSWEFDEVMHDSGELRISLDDLNGGADQLRIRGGRVLFDHLSGGSMHVTELFPNPQRFESGLAQVRSATTLGDHYYFGGRLGPDKFGIVKLDTATGGTETIYETSLEMFSIAVNADASKAMFSAFDAGRNRYVMATVDLATGETATEPVTSNLTRLEPLR